MRQPKPWFRASKNAWYVEHRGKQVRLGEHPEDAPPPKKSKDTWNAPQRIVDAFYKPMASDPSCVPEPEKLLVVQVFDMFLSHSERHNERDTYLWYKHFLQNFADFYPRLTTSELKPIHVTRWLDDQPIGGKPSVGSGAATGYAPKNALISGTSSKRVPGHVLEDIASLNVKAASEFKNLTIEVNPAYLDKLPGPERAAAFVVKPDGTAIIYLRDKPTYYEFAHELAHGYHFKSTGGTYEAWAKIPEIVQEVRVFEAVSQTKIWDRLTVPERQNAINVMKQYLDKYTSGRGSVRDPIYQDARKALAEAEKRKSIPTIPME